MASNEFDDLTKEQKYILISLYKEMLSMQPALSFDEANYFNNSDKVRDLFLPDSSSDYVAELCWSLYKKDYIECMPGDDLANDISLTDKTIVIMENRFANNIKKCIDFLFKLK